MTTIDIEIAATADDGYLLGGSSFYDGECYVGNVYSSLYDCFLRFLSVGVPNGATITAAYLVFYNHDSYGSAVLQVFGNDVDTATSPTSAAQFSALTLTTAYTDWTNSDVSAFAQSASLVDVVTEITSRARWASGNNLLLVVKNNGSPNPGYIGMYDRRRTPATPSRYTVLHIEYTEGGGASAVPAIMNSYRQRRA